MARIVDLDKDNSIYEESIIGLGNFDGVHIGHRDIILNTIKLAKEKNILSSVLIFKQHTNEIFPHFPRYYVSSLQDKIEIMDNLGVDIIYIISFTYEYAQLSKEEFIFNFIVGRLNARNIVCGPDYTFGKLSKGNVNDLKFYYKEGKINPYIIPYRKYKNEKISSTEIRNYILNGNFEEANKLLGRKYKVRGNVVHGFKIGSRELGYPTANIKLIFRYILPKQGVYLTNLLYDNKKYISLTSIGTNPTVTDNSDIKFEVYILNFDKTIYGKNVEIEFIEFMRNQIKFDTKKDLIMQMDKDKQYAINYYK